ncbi:MAG TPA: MobQ family relaxase [Steroidobacteraceae bacterium]|jgi:ATP-dependent exoDNAse (exonuclease V) alpha subunit|nr:MobQ family relaxase [Steroidobacteraceae bacterium]
MAILYFQTSSISRGAGRSAVAAAAYRSGERLRDERTGRLHNYSSRNDIPHKEIVLPTGLNTARIPWVRERPQLWNVAEKSESRRNARTAREFQVALPHELSPERRLALARTFSQDMADRYRVVVDLAVHEPRPDGDARNHHAHLLMSSREITADGFGAKAGLDMQANAARERGLPVGIAEIKAAREHWANRANEALLAAGLEARVDHRTLRAQGIDRAPMKRLSYGLIKRERRLVPKQSIERIQRNYRDRTANRGSERAESPIDTIRRLAREAWRQMREQHSGDAQELQQRSRREREKAQSQPARKRDHGHER